MNNLKARSGLKRAEGLASKARQRARKIKGLALFQQRYGDRWREMMSLDQEQTDKDLKEVFDMVDDDDSGLLDREEVALVVSFFAGDDEVTEEEIDTAMKQMDEDGSGEVDFEEFIGWWKNKVREDLVLSCLAIHLEIQQSSDHLRCRDELGGTTSRRNVENR
jgi:calmodulin